MPGAGGVFWNTALSQFFSVRQDQGIDRETHPLSTGEVVMSDGAMKEMGRKEHTWADQVLRRR